MSRLQACRVCLAHHRRMFSILNGPLQEFYENITEIPLVVGDLWPTCICYICYHMMRKFKKFIDKSLKANDLLLQLISSESEVTTDTLNMIVKRQPDIAWNYSVSPMESIMLIDPEEVNLEVTLKVEKVKSESDLEEMQDQSETAHRAKSTEDWLAAREIDFIRHEDWPSSCPDLSPLDYKIWQHLEEKACSKPHPNLESLKTSLIKAAADIDMDLVRAAIDDWPRRLKACIQNHGGHFE
ncbi:hypothetical protein evm_014306 [Chilo suppressalis]|nr:hypothetical protein evm_014306 [Chilo suppressalis]